MGLKLGQRQGLSETDVQKVEIVFGPDCKERNRIYLLKTCPTLNAIKKHNETEVTLEQIQNYYKGRIWSYGIVNYKLRDSVEFSIEEKENIKAVIRHIEKETCIEFRDVGEEDDDNVENSDSKATPKDGTTNDFITDPFGPTDPTDEYVRLTNKDGATNDFIKERSTHDDEHFATFILNSDNPGTSKADDDTDKGIQNLEDSSDNEGYTLPRVELVTDNIRRSGNRTTTTNPTSKSINENKISNEEDQKGGKVRSKRSIPPSPARRHANSILILTRSAKPGCECPKPGITEGNQVIELSTDCFNSANDLLHVFGHILGLDHQHNMWDRDDFLYIQWEDLTDEIKKEMKQKLPREASAGFAYDYQSVMHYPWLQIKNGVTNIMYPVWNDGWAMGHWQGLSSTDVRKLNLLYFQQCVERKKHAEKDKS